MLFQNLLVFQISNLFLTWLFYFIERGIVSCRVVTPLQEVSPHIIVSPNGAILFPILQKYFST